MHDRPRRPRIPVRVAATVVVVAAAAIVVAAAPADAAAAKLNASCPRNAIGQTARSGSQTLVCQRVGSRTLWRVAPTGGNVSVSLEGSWKAGAGSVAGYRVQEQLAGREAKNEAAGRSEGVAGSLDIAKTADGYAVRNVAFTVDLRKLVSDQPRRDNVLKTRGLQIDTFPSASFQGSADIAIPAGAATPGTVVNTTARGKLTLHGVTKDVEVPVAAQLRKDGRVEVLVSAPIAMADYGIEPPTIGGVVTVDDNGTFEALLVLAKA